jgi:hypothetical protein
MSKKTILISFLILIIGLLVVFVFYRQSMPEEKKLVAYKDLGVTFEEGCEFDSCCTMTCRNIEEPIEALCVSCGNIPKHLTKGENKCVKDSENKCQLKLSIKSKFYRFIYKVFNF